MLLTTSKNVVVPPSKPPGVKAVQLGQLNREQRSSFGLQIR